MDVSTKLALVALLCGMVAVSVLVIAVMHRGLRGWKSVWAKPVVVGLINGWVLFLIVPIVLRSGLGRGLGVTNGGILTIAAGMLLADVARVWFGASRSRMLSRASIGPAVSGLLALSSALLVGFTTPVAATKELSDDAAWAVLEPTYLSTSPAREVIPTIKEAFSEELRPVFLSLVAEARTLKPDSSGRYVLPAFPVRRISSFVNSKSGDISRAPDDALLALVRTYPALAAGFTPAFCAALGASDPRERARFLDAPASENDAKALGDTLAARLRAARAGRDRPVERDFSPAAVAAVSARIGDIPSEALIVVTPGADITADQCVGIPKALHWLANLPDADAAYVTALSYGLAARNRTDL